MELAHIQINVLGLSLAKLGTNPVSFSCFSINVLSLDRWAAAAHINVLRLLYPDPCIMSSNNKFQASGPEWDNCQAALNRAPPANKSIVKLLTQVWQ